MYVNWQNMFHETEPLKVFLPDTILHYLIKRIFCKETYLQYLHREENYHIFEKLLFTKFVKEKLTPQEQKPKWT